MWFMIPDENSVTRLCGKRGYDRRKRAVTLDAFQVRENDHGYLSVDWVECIDVNPKQRCIHASLERLKKNAVKYSQYVAILIAKDIRCINIQSMQLDVIHKKTSSNACHSLICGLRHKKNDPINEYIGRELAQKVKKIIWVELQ